MEVSSNAAPAPFSFHCTICFEAFHPEKRYPVVLPCGHTFLCHQCSKRLKRCMECRTSLYYTPPEQAHQPPAASAGAVGPAGRGGDLRGSRGSSFTRRGGRGGRGVTAQQQQEKRKPTPAAEPIPLPLPKNLILLSLMETAHEEARASRTTELRGNGSRPSSRAATPTNSAPRSPQLRSKSSSVASTMGGEDGEQPCEGGSAAEAPSPSGSMCLSEDGDAENGSNSPGEQEGDEDEEEPLDYEGCQTDDDDSDEGDEWCEDGGEDDLVRHGIQIFGGMCGTYAVADPNGLPIYPTIDLEEERGGIEKDDEQTAVSNEAGGERESQISSINVDAGDEGSTSQSSINARLDANREEGSGSSSVVSGESKGASVLNEVCPERAPDTLSGEDDGINHASRTKSDDDDINDCSSRHDSSPLAAQGLTASNEQVNEANEPVGGEGHTSTTVVGSDGEHRETTEATDDDAVKASTRCPGDSLDSFAPQPKCGVGMDNALPCQRPCTEVFPEQGAEAATNEVENRGTGGDDDASEKTVECLTNPQDASPTAHAVEGDGEALTMADDTKQSLSEDLENGAKSAVQAEAGDTSPTTVDQESPKRPAAAGVVGDRGSDKENWSDYHHVRRAKRGGLVCGYLRNPVIIVETKTSDSFLSLDEQASNDVSSVRGETNSQAPNSPAHAAVGGDEDASPCAQESDVSITDSSTKGSSKGNMADHFRPLGAAGRGGVLKPRSYRGECSNSQEEEAEIVASIWGDMQRRRSNAEAKDLARIWGIYNVGYKDPEGGGSEREQHRNRLPMYSTIQGGASNYVKYGGREIDASDRSMLDDDDDEENVVQIGEKDESEDEGEHDERWTDHGDQSQPKVEPSSKQNWVPYGSKVQVAHIDQDSGWVTLARNRGYLRIVPGSSQLVKVGVPLDKACQIQGIIYLLNERKKELDKNRDELDRIAAKLDRDLQKALDTSGDVDVIERRKEPESISPKRPTSPVGKFEDQSFRQGVVPRTPSPSQLNSRLSSSLGRMHPGAPPPPPPLSPRIVGSRSFETVLKGPNSDGRTPPNTARRATGPHPPLPGEATPPGKRLDFRTGMSGHMALSSTSAHIPQEVNRGMIRFMGHHNGIALGRKSRKSSPQANQTASQGDDVEGPRVVLNCSQPLRSVNDTTVVLSNHHLRN